jgi:Zn-finger nucleic acid-binding protein
MENTDKRQTATGISCPNCSMPMQEIRRYEADIDYCSSCKGVWLDRGEIDKIASAQNRFDGEHYRRYPQTEIMTIMTMTITITEDTEGEEASLAIYSTLTRQS